MFVHFNVSEYLLSIKANSYMRSSIKSRRLSKADVQFLHNFISMQQHMYKVVGLVQFSFFMQCDLDLGCTVLLYSVHSMYIDK